MFICSSTTHLLGSNYNRFAKSASPTIAHQRSIHAAGSFWALRVMFEA